MAAACGAAKPPYWWTARGVLSGSPQDYAVANAGQVKRIAYLAMQEMDSQFPGGAGPVVSNMVNGFVNATAQDYAAINAGQLKTVVAPFYDRLRECRWSCVLPEYMCTNNLYPWKILLLQKPKDYALVNSGQVKFAFSFAPFWVHMVPDFDRNGAINDVDEERLLSNGVFRFWINDDRDVGDDATDALDDAPAGSCMPEAMAKHPDIQQRLPNCQDDAINGSRDLVDFFPVLITFPVAYYPPDKYTYVLKHRDSALNFAYTSLGPGDVRVLHTALLKSGFGPAKNQPAASAETQQLTSDGAVLDTAWLQGNNRIILIEGRAPTTSPLEFEIWENNDMLCSWQMNISVSPVKNMFRYFNIRAGNPYFNTNPSNPSIDGMWTTSLGEPPNYPDGFYNEPGATRKTMIAVHGLDWDESETPAGNAEIFKRFFQSGLNARFVGVSWASNTGRTFGAPLDYGRDVLGAFVAARLISASAGLAPFWGPNTSVFAHSLGNMVVSSCIEDYGTPVGNYFMINAAVPAEAYDGRAAIPEIEQLNMIPKPWKNAATPPSFSYEQRVMCAGWSTLFSANDPRSCLTWDGRFRHVADKTTIWQFFSTGEEILRNSSGTIPTILPYPEFFNWSLYDSVATGRERVWAFNEMTKGTLNLFLSPLVPYHNQAGWSIASFWCTPDPNTGLPTIPMSPDDMAGAPANQLIAKPFFSGFDAFDSKVPNWNNSDNWIYLPDSDPAVLARLPFLPLAGASMASLKNHAKILAEAVPPLSGPAGYFALKKLQANPAQSFNLNVPPFKNPALWPTVRPTKSPGQVTEQRWLHGDYKDPAYLHTHVLYDTISKSAN